MNIWRLQTKTKSKDGKNIDRYCLENDIMAMGWDGIPEEKVKELGEEKAQELRAGVRTFEDYQNLFERMYGNTEIDNSLKRFINEVKEGDLIWIRCDGIYYIGRVGAESEWRYNSSEEAVHHDAANQRTNINWQKAGDESAVPGAVATSLIRGSTLQRIQKPGVAEFSMLMFNELSGEEWYADVKLENNVGNFYSLLSADDCEDLLCAWLMKKKGYIVIPSTNKKATQLYECVMKDPETGKHIYPQAKNENGVQSDIDAEKYLKLSENGEVWLFSTFAEIQNKELIKGNIHKADAETLFKFAGTEENRNYLSDSILKWHDLLKKNC